MFKKMMGTDIAHHKVFVEMDPGHDSLARRANYQLVREIAKSINGTLYQATKNGTDYCIKFSPCPRFLLPTLLLLPSVAVRSKIHSDGPYKK